MKKNSGFVLFETLIVSTLVLGTLIFLFIQLSSLKQSYYITFKYNTITNLYKLNALSNCLEKTNYISLQTSIDSSNYGYVDLVSNKILLNSLCSKLVDDDEINIGANNVLLTNNNITLLKANLDNTDFSDKFKNYIKKLPDTKGTNNNRLIAEFNDDTYATITMNKDINNLNIYVLSNLITNGGFENNLTDWTASNQMETTSFLKKNGNYSLNMISGNINRNINLIQNHIYYFSFDIYSTDKLNSTDYVKIENNDTNYIYKSFETNNVKKWNKYGNLFTSNSNTANLSFNLTTNTNINLDNVMLIDLTAVWEDNVPSLEWCKKNIKFIQDSEIVYK